MICWNRSVRDDNNGQVNDWYNSSIELHFSQNIFKGMAPEKVATTFTTNYSKGYLLCWNMVHGCTRRMKYSLVLSVANNKKNNCSQNPFIPSHFITPIERSKFNFKLMKKKQNNSIYSILKFLL